MLRQRTLIQELLIATASFLAACGGSDGNNVENNTTYSISGTVNGLGNGLNLVLGLNTGGYTEITRNGDFSFPDLLKADAPHTVSVVVQPSGQTCVATNTTGATTVVITCSDSDPSTPTLSLFAGAIGTSGHLDGVGSAARFSDPTGLAFDSAGRLLVVDSGNAVVRRITPSGIVTTLAGMPIGAPGVETVRGRYPYGIAIDGNDNAYVTDLSDATVSVINPNGVASTVAGASGIPGSMNGDGYLARFASPAGIAFDKLGNAFVADQSNQTIRKISPNGIVSTFAGNIGQPGSTDGKGPTARFNTPTALSIDTHGNLVVTDQGNHTIRKITPDGVVTSLAGNPGQQGQDDGIGASARFFFPTALAIDTQDSIYVWDSGNLRIRKISPAGEVSTPQINKWSDAPTSGTPSAVWGMVGGLAVDRSGNLFASYKRMYLGNSSGSSIRKITPSGTVSVFAGTEPEPDAFADGAASAARFNNPQSLAVDGLGNVYVADSGNYRVRKIDSSGSVTTLISGPAVAGLAVERSGTVYVADGNIHNKILKISPDGSVTTLASDVGYVCNTSSRCLPSLGGLALDSSGNLLVVDGTGAIYKISSMGVKTTLAGSVATYGSTDGVGSMARFNRPLGIVVASTGAIYVADSGNNTIRKITPAGEVSTFAGSPGLAGSTDGLGSAARFSNPEYLAIDEADNLYVSDRENSTLRKISPMGLVTTVAGTPAAPGVRLGKLPAGLNHPMGLAVLGDKLFVADENAVLQISHRP